MVSPTRRREAVTSLRDRHRVSERRACQLVGQARATQRYRPRKKDGQTMIVKKMHELVRRHPRFGYRRIHALLRRMGLRTNRKRVCRLWKQEGFKVPQKQGKKRRLGVSANGVERCVAERIDHVWGWDFIHDRDQKGRAIKTLSIVGEYTRECLALEVGRSFKAVDVLDVLRELFVIRGVPEHIRSDNGPEFIAQAIRAFLGRASVGTLHIEPGAPWRNGYAESFHSRLRDELLDAEVFADLAEAKSLSARWKNDDNHRRPHSSLEYRTPAEFAASLRPAPVGAWPLPPQASANHPPTLINTGT